MENPQLSPRSPVSPSPTYVFVDTPKDEPAPSTKSNVTMVRLFMSLSSCLTSTKTTQGKLTNRASPTSRSGSPIQMIMSRSASPIQLIMYDHFNPLNSGYGEHTRRRYLTPYERVQKRFCPK